MKKQRTIFFRTFLVTGVFFALSSLSIALAAPTKIPSDKAQGQPFSAPSTAQEINLMETVPEKAIFPPVPEERVSPFTGQQHKYSLLLRGNGEAVVFAKIAFFNSDTESVLTALTFNATKLSDTILVYQMTREPTCVRYDYSSNSERCLQYKEPDYYDSYYYSNITYQKADYTYNNKTFQITLPKKIATEKSGAVLVYWRSNDYTQRDFLGNYDYQFTHLTTAENISEVQIGVSVDTDLYLKGVKGAINYETQEIFAAPALVAERQTVSGDYYNNLVNQIGSGQITKQSSHLAPYESLTVNGRYADKLWKLYSTEVIAAILIFFAVVIGGIVFIRFMVNKIRSSRKKVSETIVDGEKAAHQGDLPYVWGASLISGIGFFVLAVIFLITFVLLGQIFQRFGIYNGAVLFIAVFGFFSIAILLLTLVPALYVGIKRGALWGAITLGTSFMLIAIAIAAIVVLLYIFIVLGGYNNDIIRDPILYLQESVRGVPGGLIESAPEVDLQR